MTLNRRSFLGSLLASFFLKFKKKPPVVIDYNGIVMGPVNIEATVIKESIDISRIPKPVRFYMTSQEGSIKFRMEDYDPETIQWPE